MTEFDSSDDHQPVMWLSGRAIYAAHFVVLVFVVSMLVTTLLMAFNAAGLLTWLPFSSDRVMRGEIWRVFTYGLVNPPSLGFAIDMLMIVWFGRELEKVFGRRTFLLLYGCLYLLSPLLFTLIGIWRPMQLSGESGGFALFIGFATFYPNVPIFFNLLAKWVAAILVGIYSLIDLGNHDWVGLISLWSTVGFATAFVRYQQGHFRLPSFRLKKRAVKGRATTVITPRQTAAERASQAEVDALLDKIAQSGFGSLTPKERAKLDSARDEIMRRGAGRRR